MPGEIYTVTIKYELRHTHGQLAPSIDEVQESVEKAFPQEHDTIHVAVTKGQRFEGCRVSVDEVEIQEAKVRR